MTIDLMNYNEMVETALRGVVREALSRAAKDGLKGNHHFYVTFRTGCPGVDIPDYLKAQYAEEMTIVLQHQYWGLEVDEAGFEVTLSFSGVNERLSIPFAAITAFADPGVQFGLQFNAEEEGEESDVASQDNSAKEGGTQDDKRPAPGTGEVVNLDTFRTKK